MSIDFTYVYACLNSNNNFIVDEIDKYLRRNQFKRDREIVVSNSQNPYRSEEEKILLLDKLSKAQLLLEQWDSIYFEYFSPVTSFGIQFDFCDKQLDKCFVFINKSIIYKLHKNGLPDSLYDLMGFIAEAVGATGGYGGFQVEHIQEKPDELLTEILINPLNKNLWFDAIVIPNDHVSLSTLRKDWEPDFMEVKKNNFMFFINNEFLKQAKEFG